MTVDEVIALCRELDREPVCVACKSQIDPGRVCCTTASNADGTHEDPVCVHCCAPHKAGPTRLALLGNVEHWARAIAWHVGQVGGRTTEDLWTRVERACELLEEAAGITQKISRIPTFEVSREETPLFRTENPYTLGGRDLEEYLDVSIAIHHGVVRITDHETEWFADRAEFEGAMFAISARDRVALTRGDTDPEAAYDLFCGLVPGREEAGPRHGLHARFIGIDPDNPTGCDVCGAEAHGANVCGACARTHCKHCSSKLPAAGPCSVCD